MKANERLAREYVPTTREVLADRAEGLTAELLGVESSLTQAAERLERAIHIAAVLTHREPLDVEVLARAWHAVYERDPQAVPITWDTADEATRRMWRNHARLAAAEYARLEAER